MFGDIYVAFIRVPSVWDCIGTTPGGTIWHRWGLGWKVGTGMIEVMTKKVMQHICWMHDDASECGYAILVGAGNELGMVNDDKGSKVRGVWWSGNVTVRVHDEVRVLQMICDQKHERMREQGWWTISNTVLSHRAMYIEAGDEGQEEWWCRHDASVLQMKPDKKYTKVDG